ncbi:MAG TPA: DUF222 domain-containing protein, partial [Mycobacterium sp.]|nr:DUF222 domain-containing protein [Mycobacterium sp.]
MNQSLQSLREGLASLDAAWTDALPAFGIGWGDAGDADGADDVADAVQAEFESMSDAGLMTSLRAAGRLLRQANSLLARGGAEVARRSPAEAGGAGLAKRQGYQNPAQLIAAITGSSVATASRLVSVGRATATRRSLTGQPLPPAHPHVAVALSGGGIGIEAAGAITAMLDRVARRADPDQADAYEQVLAQRSGDIPLETLLRAIREAEARLDQDGVQPREEDLCQDRAVYLRQDHHGMLHLSAHLDPESAGPVKAAIEAIVTHTLRAAGRLLRHVNALLAGGGAEVARRSPAEAGGAGLAKRQGYQNPAQLVAAITGGSVASASRLVSVGRATAAGRSLTGQPLPAAHPHVARALSGGGIGIEAAGAITSMLDR